MATNELHLVVWNEAHPNTYFDAAQFNDEGVLHFHALREGQRVEEYLSELEAGQVREKLGLAPGRTMPTKEEIEADPVPPPLPAADPRDVKLAALETRLAKLEASAEAAPPRR